MSERFRLTLAQLNPVVGDLDGNAAQARAAWAEAKAAGADMIAFPEMFITGYNTQDLILKPVFHQRAIEVIHALAADCAEGPAIGIGGPVIEGARLHNAWYVLSDGKVQVEVLKHHLPNETVFDEKRLFEEGRVTGPYQVGPIRIGSPICEDAWHEDVAETLAETGAELLLVPNGSPYYREKLGVRQMVMVSRVIETGLPLIYLNMVGGQDDQVFDGGSFALNPHGKLAVQMPMFEAGLAHVDLERGAEGWQIVPQELARIPDVLEADYRAMVMGLGDYMGKTGFKKAVLGLSGGVDSAIVATIAADALGPENVQCVMLPSEYTSDESLEDAAAVAERLGCRLDTLPISGPRAAVSEVLGPLFEGLAPDVTEENIQSRLRGLLLMALSNKFGSMLLTTGNKSEVAVGYATIYGDMAGGYNPIKDMYKTRVFETCRWRNANHRVWMKAPAGEVIPPRVIEKPPSAELRADQKDSDSLPDYPVLDAILTILVDQDGSIEDCVTAGYARADAERVQHLLYISEYKRFQSAPGTRLSKKAFWLDRRYPIVNGFRDRG